MSEEVDVKINIIEKSFERPEYSGLVTTGEILGRKICGPYLLYLFVRYSALYILYMKLRSAAEKINNLDDRFNYLTMREAIILPITIVLSLLIVYLIVNAYIYSSKGDVKITRDKTVDQAFNYPILSFSLMGMVSTFFMASLFHYVTLPISNGVVVGYIVVKELIILILSLLIHINTIKESIIDKN